jgi:hypothetical protein
MEVFIEKCAGLDVHSETIVACVIKGNHEDEMYIETETFPTLTKDLFRLLKWLEGHEVTHIAMESTGVYWKPVFNILEDFFDITLANAQRIKKCTRKKNRCFRCRMDSEVITSWFDRKELCSPCKYS